MEETGTALRAACRQLDKAASKGIIHKSQAANRKSAIARTYAELSRGWIVLSSRCEGPGQTREV